MYSQRCGSGLCIYEVIGDCGGKGYEISPYNPILHVTSPGIGVLSSAGFGTPNVDLRKLLLNVASKLHVYIQNHFNYM